jgi:hypothetical protein
MQVEAGNTRQTSGEYQTHWKIQEITQTAIEKGRGKATEKKEEELKKN